MAFNKKEKAQIKAEYTKWLQNSEAVFVVSFNGMTMKSIDDLRAKARESGAQLHVVKNTLITRSIEEANLPKAEFFEGTTLVGFAVSDPPALAKIIADATKGNEIFAIKGGYLGSEVLSAAQVKALADLPPLPIMRAKMLGLFNTPATQLVRTLAEPARRLAFVVKAHSEQPAAVAA